jgi:hypothetical protein
MAPGSRLPGPPEPWLQPCRVQVFYVRSRAILREALGSFPIPDDQTCCCERCDCNQSDSDVSNDHLLLGSFLRWSAETDRSSGDLRPSTYGL